MLQLKEYFYFILNLLYLCFLNLVLIINPDRPLLLCFLMYISSNSDTVHALLDLVLLDDPVLVEEGSSILNGPSVNQGLAVFVVDEANFVWWVVDAIAATLTALLLIGSNLRVVGDHSHSSHALAVLNKLLDGLPYLLRVVEWIDFVDLFLLLLLPVFVVTLYLCVLCDVSRGQSVSSAGIDALQPWDNVMSSISGF